MKKAKHECANGVLLFISASSIVHAQNLASPVEKAQQFESKIRPILYERCFGCHAEKLQRGGLRLDSRGLMMKGGDSGGVVASGEPDKSLLIKAIRYDSPLKMPPSGRLSDAEISELTLWVKASAFFPEAKPSKPIPMSSKKTTPSPVATAKTKFWLFQPVQKPAVPNLKKEADSQECSTHILQSNRSLN